MPSENQSGMQCVECEGLLAEAIDGALHGSTLAAFEAHQQSCPACRTMVEEATAGLHWLKGLDDVEPPRHLVHNILAQTIGALPSEHAVVSPRGETTACSDGSAPMVCARMLCTKWRGGSTSSSPFSQCRPAVASSTMVRHAGQDCWCASNAASVEPCRAPSMASASRPSHSTHCIPDWFSVGVDSPV